jgi:hypothetical protein
MGSSPSRMLLVLLAVAGLFGGACKDKEDPPPASGSPPSSDPAEPKPTASAGPAGAVSADKTAAPPPTDDWREVLISKAGVAVQLPDGATVPQELAGHDLAFAGAYFRVVMPSGYDLYFAEQHGKEGVGIAAEKRRYLLDKENDIELVYEADDAVVVNRVGKPPAGKYCEVTACGRLAGRPLCATHAGAIIDGDQVRKLTDVECLSVVAIARSIHAL